MIAYYQGRALRVWRRLRTCALAVMQTLSGYLPGIAHAAVDFWVDQNGHPKVAHITGAFRLDWLSRTGDDLALGRLHRHPPQLALMLLEKGVDRLDVDFGRAR